MLTLAAGNGDGHLKRSNLLIPNTADNYPFPRN